MIGKKFLFVNRVLSALKGETTSGTVHNEYGLFERWLKKCVPCCRSNYDPTVYISCFQFPKEEGRRNLWLKKINRKDYSPSSKNAVCIKHFSEKFVITEDHAVRDDGSVLTVKRIYPKLTPDAYPSIFPNQPAYLSSDPVSKRKTPSQRRNEMLKRDRKKFTDWCLKDIIKTFDDFLKEFPTKLTKEWVFIVQEDDVLFDKINIFNGQAPQIKVSFKVDRNLSGLLGMAK
ncbi:THAP-type domain-containing protein [Caerostris extrusa]|uniref:THAP-type domain-containing protein n=1 Tax=Caerostris extrusa TaxID=172846 RepID=A0AAV4UM52_CAEEX|nr:THAP-type domain-containing protein [Caerostris extrusa]